MTLTLRPLTDEDIQRLPRDLGKWEVIDGKPSLMPTYYEHDFISSLLLARLLPIALPLGFVTNGQAGFRMKNRNLRAPDISFTLKERKSVVFPTPGFGQGAPDLCIEIISPSEVKSEMDDRMAEYFAAGAQQVWHVFPETERILVYASPASAAAYESPDEITGSPLLPTLRFRVGEIFATD